MATSEIPVPIEIWTLIATGPEAGSFTKRSNNDMFIAQQASLPAPSSDVGHRVDQTLTYYTLLTGENLYVKSFLSDNILTKTV